MKAKFFALLVLFFTLSLAAWSYSPGQAVEAEAELAAPEWPELPTCAGRDRGEQPGGECEGREGRGGGRSSASSGDNYNLSSFYR